MIFLPRNMGAADLLDVKESWEIFAADLQMLFREFFQHEKKHLIIDRSNKT